LQPLVDALGSFDAPLASSFENRAGVDGRATEQAGTCSWITRTTKDMSGEVVARAPFECVCGFTAGTSFAWEKHLALR